MPKRKDWIVIAVVLIAAVVMLGVSKLMPKTDLSTKVADVTLAPDAIEYLDTTPAPEATAEPTAEPTAAPEVTAEPTAAPEVTAEPTAEPTAQPAAPKKEAGWWVRCRPSRRRRSAATWC